MSTKTYSTTKYLLTGAEVPRETKSYKPVSHGQLIDLTMECIHQAGFVLDKERCCWVPKFYMLLGKSQYSKDSQLVNGARMFKDLFKGARCHFSKRMKRTITAYSLAAVGASDFGVQSVIFGVLKAMNDEMELGISNKALADCTPSALSLANWEYDLAAGCMATIINQIATDAERMMTTHGKKLQITLITDHGNRRGVDHFVKQICWTSYVEMSSKSDPTQSSPAHYTS